MPETLFFIIYKINRNPAVYGLNEAHSG